jgi:N-acetylglucosamine repressor
MAEVTGDRGLVRAINRAAVLRAVKESAPVSRADLARLSGLSHVTVGAIVSDLMDLGLLVEGDLAPSTGGRPSRLLGLNADSYCAMGFKLTEDHAFGALTNLSAEVLAEVERPLPDHTPAGVVAVLEDSVQRLSDAAGLQPGRLLGVGVGLAGVVNGREGVCRISPFLGWRDVPLAALAREALGVPVLVDNDVNTLALAERWFGAGQGVDNFLLVTLGRGVGLGIVIDGSLYRGTGGAGEFGHVLVDGSDRRCSCGKTGCLEAHVAEGALLEAASERRRRRRRRQPASVDELYELAERDAACAAVLTDAGGVLGRELANLVNLFAPTLVILSGEGVRAGPRLLGAAEQETRRHVFSGLRDTYRLVAEALPEGAWARGAASLVLAELFELPTKAQLDLLPTQGAGR